MGALYKGLIPNIGRGMTMNMGMMACSDQAKEMMVTLLKVCAVIKKKKKKFIEIPHHHHHPHPHILSRQDSVFFLLSFLSSTPDVSQDDPKKPGMTARLGAAAAGGFFAAFLSLPFDLLKSRMQDVRVGPDGKRPFTGLADCAMQAINPTFVLFLFLF